MNAPSSIRAIKAAASSALLTFLLGCAPFNYTGEDSPLAQTAISTLHPKPHVALVLSSGGQRGYAHLGVMKALEDAGIEYDLVVGSSVGALLGAFWAEGRNASELDRISRRTGMRDKRVPNLSSQSMCLPRWNPFQIMFQ